MELEAIQVLTSVDDKIKSGRDVIEVKKIKTVHRFKNGLSLDEVLCYEDVKDLPLFVFSIAGKTRAGKSFLLNLMIKHLEWLEKKLNGPSNVEGHEDWLSGNVPNCFPWKNGIESVTRGLWIYPKIFRLKDAFDNEIGVLLLDTEGMYDGEATDGEIIAISGISAAISYLQMFNLKEKITSDYLEGIVRSLIQGIEEMDLEDTNNLKEDYKLMFVVRDWIGEEDFPFGIEGGDNYLLSDRQRGTTENQLLWERIHNTFPHIKCVLVPDPGRVATKKEFNETGNLNMLDGEFLDEVKSFVEYLFKPDNLIPPLIPLTGNDIHYILSGVDGKIADEEQSFLNVFTDHGNHTKVEKWRDSFGKTLEDVTFSGLPETKSEMSEILHKAERALRGKSREKYLDELTKDLQGAYNSKVVEILFKQYESGFQDFARIEKLHSGIWSYVNRNLQKYICGDNDTRKKVNITFAKKSAAHYYGLLHQEHKVRFTRQCSTKETLQECAGLDEKEIQSFKECEDFSIDEYNNEAVYALWLKEYQCLKNEFINILLEHITKITGIHTNTLKKLRKKQYEHFESFTLLNKEWDDIAVGDYILIAKKVGYAMFGLPSQLRTEAPQSPDTSGPSLSSVFKVLSTYSRASENKENLGYSSDQESKIWPIVEKIRSLSPKNKVKFSCIFLVYGEDNEKDPLKNLPLFKIKPSEQINDIKYIDSNCRVYERWDDFLISNKLPDIVYCHPLDGSYSKTKGFIIAFANSPASKKATKMLKRLDQTRNVVTFVAGVAGGVALFGVASPIIVGSAIIGGAAAGVCGIVREVQKIQDKARHSEPVKKGDYFRVAANVLAVGGSVGMALGRFVSVAAEGAVILGSKVAAGLTSLSSLTVLITDSNDTSELINLIAQVEENSMKILFYFNATSPENALNIIRTSFNLEDGKSTVDTLMALVENNCIQYAAETETADMRIEKYVSQNTVSLATSILTAVSPNIKDIILHYCDVNILFQCFEKDAIRIVDMVEEACEMMEKEPIKEDLCNKVQELMIKLNDEIAVSKTRLTNVLCCSLDLPPNDSTFVQSLLNVLEEEVSHRLILSFRHLTISLISEVRKANDFFNNIEHKAIHLENHYLGNELCHPLHEIVQKIREIVDQTESAIDLKTININEMNNFMFQVLKLLNQVSNETWTVHQFSMWLISITEELVSRSEKVRGEHQELVTKEENLSCDRLTGLFKELGLEGYDYGMWVLKKVLREIEKDSEALEKMVQVHQVQENLLIMPAWRGIIDSLYYFCSEKPVSDKFTLIKEIKIKIPKTNYHEEIYLLLNEYCMISVFLPCDKVDNEMKTFIVYSEVNKNNNEQGFIGIL